MQLRKGGQPRRWLGREPIGQDDAPGLSLLAIPLAIGRQAAAQSSNVKPVIPAQPGQPGLVSARRQAEQRLNPGAQRQLPGARPFPQFPRLGTAQQIARHCIRSEAQRQQRQGIEQGRVTACFGIDQQSGQHLAQQQFAVTVLHGANARSQPGFGGKGRQQPLGKGVDRIDAQAAAWAIEHPGKQRAGAGDHFGSGIGTDGKEVAGQHGIRQAHPAGEHFADPHGHFRRAGLGEGQAKDLPRLDVALQQQAQDARRQHLGLAGPGACRKPDRFQRIGRRQLVVLKGKDHPAHAWSSRSSRACHSSSRINWS